MTLDYFCIASGPTSTRAARDVDLEDEEEYEEDSGYAGRGGARQQETIGGKDAGNVLRGYKATMHSKCLLFVRFITLTTWW